MSDYIRFQVTTKLIDANNNETQLDNYQASQTYTKYEVYKATLLTGANVDLPIIANQVAFEFQSDQDVTFNIKTSAGVQESALAATRNLIGKFGVNKTYNVANASGATANLVWRVFI